METEKTAAERREELAIMWICRGYLYCHDMLSSAESKRVCKRISAFQDKHRIAITREQIDCVEIKYNDEP
jgi:hypothetical protein